MNKVQSGQPLRIPAETFNAFLDATQDFRNRQRSVSSESQPAVRQTGIVKVKNASGEARGRFEVLGIDCPIFTPTDSLDTFQNNILLVGVVPDKEDHPGRFCILLEPLDVDGIGLAVISGVCPVRLDVEEESDSFAEIEHDETGRDQCRSAPGSDHPLHRPDPEHRRAETVRLPGLSRRCPGRGRPRRRTVLIIFGEGLSAECALVIKDRTIWNVFILIQWSDVAGLKTTEHPVEMVSWNDAAEFCAKLSQQEKLNPFYLRAGETIAPLDGTGYRLPSEAEWEFACRAGTPTKYWIGDKAEDLVRAGWFRGNSGGRTHAAGGLKANPFGLADIHGNVWEWVQDGWDATLDGPFQDKPAINPNVPFYTCSQRMLRGGHWEDSASKCRSSNRIPNVPTNRNLNLGFRVSLHVDAVKQLREKQPAAPAPVEARD